MCIAARVAEVHLGRDVELLGRARRLAGGLGRARGAVVQLGALGRALLAEALDQPLEHRARLGVLAARRRAPRRACSAAARSLRRELGRALSAVSARSGACSVSQ